MFDSIQGFKWLIAILMPVIEAFFPPIPLAVFVTINVMAFGFWTGFLLSWIGTVLGSALLFLFLRKINNRWIKKLISGHERAESIINWIKKKGFKPVLILMFFPFTPSFLITAVAVLVGIKFRNFVILLIIGKLIMVMALNSIGYGISSIAEKPLTSGVILLVALLGMFIAKRIILFMEKKSA